MVLRLISLAAGLALLAGCQSPPQPLPDACYQPPESGMCRATMQRYYYDSGTDTCRSFIWGGCNGTVPFETLEACARTCDTTAADTQATPTMNASDAEETQ